MLQRSGSFGWNLLLGPKSLKIEQRFLARALVSCAQDERTLKVRQDSDEPIVSGYVLPNNLGLHSLSESIEKVR